MWIYRFTFLRAWSRNWRLDTISFLEYLLVLRKDFQGRVSWNRAKFVVIWATPSVGKCCLILEFFHNFLIDSFLRFLWLFLLLRLYSKAEGKIITTDVINFVVLKTRSQNLELWLKISFTWNKRRKNKKKKTVTTPWRNENLNSSFHFLRKINYPPPPPTKIPEEGGIFLHHLTSKTFQMIKNVSL